jgi:hypothetical protein
MFARDMHTFHAIPRAVYIEVFGFQDIQNRRAYRQVVFNTRMTVIIELTYIRLVRE